MILRTGIVDTANGPSVQEVEPILITNHINDKREVVVETYERILEMDLASKWETYYKGRYEILKKLISTYGSIE
jgi:hypothetical protein